MEKTTGTKQKILSIFSSVQSLSHVRLPATNGPQHARPPCPSPTPGAYSNSCPLSQWCHLTISCSVDLFSSCLQSFPTSGSFQMSQFFDSSGKKKWLNSNNLRKKKWTLNYLYILKSVFGIKTSIYEMSYSLIVTRIYWISTICPKLC